MSDPKPLKPIKADQVPENESHKYIYNRQEKMAIKLPTKVLNALEKIGGCPPYDKMFYFDFLAMIIRYRKLSNVYEGLKLWEQNSIQLDKYPINSVHSQISKLFYHSPLAAVLTEEELDELRYFICRCPEGYEFKHIWAHVEFKPIIT